MSQRELRIIESRIVTELLHHFLAGEERVFFGALVENADDETTIGDLLNVAEYLRSRPRKAGDRA